MKSKVGIVLPKSTFDFVHSVFFGSPQRACDIGVSSTVNKIYDDVIFISPPRLGSGRKKTDRCMSSPNQRREILVDHLKKHGSAFFLRDYNMFGWGYNHMSTTIKSLIRDDLIETFGKKSHGYYAQYRLKNQE